LVDDLKGHPVNDPFGRDDVGRLRHAARRAERRANKYNAVPIADRSVGHPA